MVSVVLLLRVTVTTVTRPTMRRTRDLNQADIKAVALTLLYCAPSAVLTGRY